MDELGADKFKMLLLHSGERPECQSWADFSKLIAGALSIDKSEGYSRPFMDRYAELIRADDVEGARKAIIADQMDNYILGSFALQHLGVPKDLPVIAYAAENKRLYEGWRGEISNLRALILFGFDIDAVTDGGGNTALHCMCALAWGKGVHNRAIDLLLDAGADCNIQNDAGDTPLTYLAGSFPWTQDVHQAFQALLEHGANPMIPSGDGKTALVVLKDTQAGQEKSQSRQAVIDLLELTGSTPRAKPARVAPRL